MTEEYKKMILFIGNLIGFLENEENYKGIPIPAVSACRAMVPMAEKVALKMPCDNEEVERLMKDIEAGNIKFMMATKIEEQKIRKTLGKRQIAVQREHSDIVSEHAIEFTCKNCNRNKKKCLLRTALKGLKIEGFHDEKDKCMYKID